MVTPRAWTRDLLRTAARRRCEYEDTAHVGDAELNDYINEGLSELYDILIMSYGDHFLATTSLSLVAGTESYSLPDDFYKVLAVFYNDAAGDRYPLERFSLDDLGEWQNGQVLPITSGEHYRYRVFDRSLYVTPEPDASGSIELWYVPSCPWLSDDVTVLSYNFVNGWEEYILEHAAMKMLRKEESDIGPYVMRKNELRARIIAASANRDTFRPMKVRDAYGRRDPKRFYR